jgi:hypothetical protein
MYSRKEGKAQRINYLAVYLPWRGTKNKPLGGFAPSREFSLF